MKLWLASFSCWFGVRLRWATFYRQQSGDIKHSRYRADLLSRSAGLGVLVIRWGRTFDFRWSFAGFSRGELLFAARWGSERLRHTSTGRRVTGGQYGWRDCRGCFGGQNHSFIGNHHKFASSLRPGWCCVWLGLQWFDLGDQCRKVLLLVGRMFLGLICVCRCHWSGNYWGRQAWKIIFLQRDRSLFDLAAMIGRQTL